MSVLPVKEAVELGLGHVFRQQLEGCRDKEDSTFPLSAFSSLAANARHSYETSEATHANKAGHERSAAIEVSKYSRGATDAIIQTHRVEHPASGFLIEVRNDEHL